MTRLDAGILRRQFAEHALPQRVPLRHRVAFVDHAHAAAAVRARELEGVADNAVYTLVGVQLLLNRHFVFGAGLEAAADADVEALGILAEHDEVDRLRRLPLQRAQSFVEQLHWTVVDVEIEFEPRAEQDVTRVPVVGNPRIAERADEDRVELVAQHRIAVRRHGYASLQVMLRPPWQHLEVEAAAEHLFDRAQHLHRLRGRLDADAVAGNDRYAHWVIWELGNWVLDCKSGLGVPWNVVVIIVPLTCAAIS